MSEKLRAVQPEGLKAVINGVTHDVEIARAYTTAHGTEWEFYLYEDETNYTTEMDNVYLISHALTTDDFGYPIYDGALLLINNLKFNGLCMVVKVANFAATDVIGGFKIIQLRPFLPAEIGKNKVDTGAMFMSVVGDVFTNTDDNALNQWLQYKAIPISYSTMADAIEIAVATEEV